ncbi:MAG: hypothetical protein ACRDJE_28230, partial [Dehalococcoidia bacterium]
MNEHEIQTLAAKIRQFIGELTPEEQEQVRAMQMRSDDVSGLMSSPLWDKAREAAGALTPEETEQLVRLLERTGVTAPTDDAGNVQGFRMAAYEEDDGWKGKPGTNPNGVGKGGTPILGPVLGFLFIVGSIMPGVGLVADYHAEPSQD